MVIPLSQKVIAVDHNYHNDKVIHLTSQKRTQHNKNNTKLHPTPLKTTQEPNRTSKIQPNIINNL